MGFLVQTSSKMLKQGGAELVICYFCVFTFSEKKKPQKKKDLSFKNGKAKITSTLNFLLNKILHLLFHTIITQLF